jgi:hypothetical protein
MESDRSFSRYAKNKIIAIKKERKILSFSYFAISANYFFFFATKIIAITSNEAATTATTMMIVLSENFPSDIVAPIVVSTEVSV